MTLSKAVLVLTVSSAAASAYAQCPTWSGGFGTTGVSGEVGHVRAIAEFDRGAGAELYAAGSFETAGNAAALGLARWNRLTWSAIGDFSGDARDMVAFDDGAGAALYLGGSFTSVGGVNASNIAKFDGTSWSPVGLGVDGLVMSLVVHDDGTGPALYAAGNFQSAGGVTSRSLARWNGSTWSAVPGLSNWVTSMCSFDDGSGPSLFMSGWLAGASLPAFLRLNSSGWTNLGSLSNLSGSQVINAFSVYDDGTGPALYLGAGPTTVGSATFAGLGKWDGATLTNVGGVGGTIGRMQVFDDGSGAKLFVTGTLLDVGGAPTSNYAIWDGATWTPSTMGFEVPTYAGGFATSSDMTVLHTPSGDELFAGGGFVTADGEVAHGIARWNGAAWSALQPVGAGVNGDVHALCAMQDGALERLFAAGQFSSAGDVLARNIAEWNGSSWQPLDAGLGSPNTQVKALCAHDDGSGMALYALGTFGSIGTAVARSVARWDGVSWSTVGNEVDAFGSPDVFTSMLSHDDGSGSKLYVAGRPSLVVGSTTSQHSIVRWDGAQWETMPSGEPNTSVNAMIEFDDGTGSVLIAAGAFTSCGGTPTSRIAKWDGAQWSPLGAGLNTIVNALAVHDDGSGPALYAGGAFTSSSTTAVARVAKWNGLQWLPLGAGIGDAAVNALISYDDGAGAELIATGKFSLAGGLGVQRIAAWRNGAWSGFGDGPSGENYLGPVTLAVYHDGGGPFGSLFVAGGFSRAGGAAFVNIARWSNPCAGDATSYCTSGTTSSGCTPTMSAVGRASVTAASSFVIQATQLEGDKSGHVFYGLNGPHSAPWGASSHFLCVKAPTQRTVNQSTGGTSGLCDGSFTLDWNAYVASHPGALGVPFTVGQEVRAQAFFRDPAGVKTTALSDGLRFVICP